MKVFAGVRKTGYCGGVVIIAANNKSEAIETLALNKNIYCQNEYKEWYELPKITSDAKEPHVIDTGVHTD